jgi:hypothetical protein
MMTTSTTTTTQQQQQQHDDDHRHSSHIDDHTSSSSSSSKVSTAKPSTSAKPRKKSQRSKGLRAPIPNASKRLKELWATPEFRAKMQARDKARVAAAKLNPAKFTRYGVPDGMRRADAEPLWTQARLLADRFIEILKDKGELASPRRDDDSHSHGDSGAPKATAAATTEATEAATEATAVEIPETDEGKAEAVLREAFVIAVGPTGNPQMKLQAINVILRYTRAQPESRTALMLGCAEDFLTDLAAPIADTTTTAAATAATAAATAATAAATAAAAAAAA